MRRWLVLASCALTAHAVTIVWLTWPVAVRAATHLPAQVGRPAADCLLLAWALAHESRALVSDPWALPEGNAFHPAPHAIFYGEAGFGAVPLFAPVFLASGNPALALNFTWLAGVLLTATALHLVIAQWTGSWMAGLVGGWFFLTRHWVLWTWIPVAPNYAVVGYLPLIMWLAAKPLASVGRALALGALVALQGLTSVYVAAATILPLAVLALARLTRGATRASGLRLLAALGLALALVILAYSGYLAVRAENPLLEQQSIYSLVRWGDVVLPWGPFATGQPMALSPLALSVIAIGFGRRILRRQDARGDHTSSAWRYGALWAVVGLVGSLTRYARWGEWRVPLPLALLADWVPIAEVLRSPGRLGIAGLVGLTVLLGAGFAECARPLERVRRTVLRRVLITGLAGLIGAGLYRRYETVDVHLLGFPGPLPRAYPLARPPELSPMLAQLLATRAGPVLELPVGPNAHSHAEAMYRSIFHGRPVVNGYNGYWPAEFPVRMRLACALPDPGALRELRRITGVETILVHLPALDHAPPAPGPYGCLPDMPRREAWLDAAKGARPDLRLLAGSEEDLAFAVEPATP